ncbi:UBA-like_superfamily [Hexamita inflata]|uniref:UBA-like superfamily n=1 Tax=Hexamita inflata TaxID=28002 RepID=A0AA86UVT1_9EUKA|nr:UBA-like superfamily [Hexamita inflata]
MQGNIQQFMDITNSSQKMAEYYLRQLQGNLEHAVAQFYEDDMPKKVESFVRQTGSTKI